MKFTIFGVFFWVLSFSGFVLAKDDTTFIMGTMETTALVGKSHLSDCSLQDSQKIYENDIVLVIGLSSCSPNHASTKNLYEISWQGKSYFVEPEQVKLVPQDLRRMEKLSASSPESSEWKKVRAQGVYASRVIYAEKLKKLVKTMGSYKPYGFAVIDWVTISESEDSKETGVRFQLYNPTKQDIKYIWLTIQGYSASDNPIGKPITLQTTEILESETSLSYQFEHLWMTNLVEYVTLKNIRVQYIDGTEKMIARPHKIVLPKQEAMTFHSRFTH